MPIGLVKFYDIDAPKVRINMTLSEDLVRAVRGHTDCVKARLMLAVAEERRKRDEDESRWRETCASWNEFHKKHGNFADEYNGPLLPEGYVP